MVFPVVKSKPAGGYLCEMKSSYKLANRRQRTGQGLASSARRQQSQGPQRRGGVERSKGMREAISKWSLFRRLSESDMTASVYFSSCSMHTSMCRIATLSFSCDIQLYGSSHVAPWKLNFCGFFGGFGGVGGGGGGDALQWRRAN